MQLGDRFMIDVRGGGGLTRVGEFLQFGPREIEFFAQLALDLFVAADVHLEVRGQRRLELEALEGLLEFFLQLLAILRLAAGQRQLGLQPLDVHRRRESGNGSSGRGCRGRGGCLFDLGRGRRFDAGLLQLGRQFERALFVRLGFAGDALEFGLQLRQRVHAFERGVELGFDPIPRLGLALGLLQVGPQDADFVRERALAHLGLVLRLQFLGEGFGLLALVIHLHLRPIRLQRQALGFGAGGVEFGGQALGFVTRGLLLLAYALQLRLMLLGLLTEPGHPFDEGKRVGDRLGQRRHQLLILGRPFALGVGGDEDGGGE